MYQVMYEKQMIKDLRKLDPEQRKLILAWISKNLMHTENPRQHGKALKGELKDYWRYRIGDYRLLADIDDEKVCIFAIKVAHRKDVYK